MQFDARVDAFVPRDSGIESMRYDFFLDREREEGERKKANDSGINDRVPMAGRCR